MTTKRKTIKDIAKESGFSLSTVSLVLNNHPRISPANPPVMAVLGGASGPALIPVLVKTGRAQLVFGILLAVGLVLSVEL